MRHPALDDRNAPPSGLHRAAFAIVLAALAAIVMYELSRRRQPDRGDAVDSSDAAAVCDAVDGAAQRARARAERLERLRALGYVDWGTASSEQPPVGVVRHDNDAAAVGLNLYTAYMKSRAYLIDMEGNLVHSWSGESGERGWQHAELSPGGPAKARLYVVVKDKALLALDWSSKVLWRREGRFRHDVSVDGAGRIFAIEGRSTELAQAGATALPVVDDSIVILSADGEEEGRLSVMELLGNEVPDTRVERLLAARQKQPADAGLPTPPPDLLHTNSIQVVDLEVRRICSPGNLLISIRDLDRIAVVDVQEESIRWSWGDGIIQEQHHPTLLPDGKILLFDNGVRRERSRVLLLEPRTKRITWRYNGEAEERLFSERLGAAQLLPNGNILVTESAAGRAFELTPGGRVVWEFYNPRVDHEANRNAVIYRMTRYPLEVTTPVPGAAGPPGNDVGEGENDGGTRGDASGLGPQPNS